MTDQPTSDLDRRAADLAATMDDQPTFREKMTEALWAREQSYRNLHARLEKLASLARNSYVAEVTTIDAASDSHILECPKYHDGRTTYTTVHAGKCDHWHFFTVDEAMIHLIAVRHGMDLGTAGTIVPFIASSLGVKVDD